MLLVMGRRWRGMTDVSAAENCWRKTGSEGKRGCTGEGRMPARHLRFAVEEENVKGGERWLNAGWLSNRPEPIRSHNPTRIVCMRCSR